MSFSCFFVFFFQRTGSSFVYKESQNASEQHLTSKLCEEIMSHVTFWCRITDYSQGGFNTFKAQTKYSSFLNTTSRLGRRWWGEVGGWSSNGWENIWCCQFDFLFHWLIFMSLKDCTFMNYLSMFENIKLVMSLYRALSSRASWKPAKKKKYFINGQWQHFHHKHQRYVVCYLLYILLYHSDHLTKRHNWEYKYIQYLCYYTHFTILLQGDYRWVLWQNRYNPMDFWQIWMIIIFFFFFHIFTLNRLFSWLLTKASG